MASFEEQFLLQEKIESPGGYIRVVDIEPPNETKNLPVLLACGWGETLETR